MASEDNFLKKIMDLQAIFLNKHKLPTLFTFQLKHGLIILVLKHVMAKFGREFKIWTTCSQSHKTKITMVREVGKSPQFYTSKKTTNETSCWPRAPGLQEFVAVGFSQNFERVLEEWWKEEVVRYGDPDFVPSFWPHHIWAWQEVNKNPNNLKASDYSGPGTITDFLNPILGGAKTPSGNFFV